MPEFLHSINLQPIQPQPEDFLIQPRLGDQKDSITHNIQWGVYQEWKKRKRPPNSIHCSNYWHTCDFAFMAERRGVDPGWEDWNISNTLSATAGDTSHVNFQKYLVDAGLAIKVPSFDPDPEKRAYERDNGILVDAIELNLWDCYKPFSQAALDRYTGLGYCLTGVNELHYLLTEFYRFGVRDDSMIIKPGAYNFPMPGEIKSTKAKKFDEIEEWVNKYLHWQRSGGKKRGIKQPKTPQKVVDYMFQLQMQMHWTPDPFTGLTPQWGVLYLVSRDDEARSIELFVKYNPQHINYWLPKIRERKLLWDSGEVGETKPSKDNCFFCQWNTHVCPDENKFPRFGSWKQEFNRGNDSSPWRDIEDASFEFLVQAS